MIKYYYYSQLDTVNANSLNDNAIYSCYTTVNTPSVNGWKNILVTRMSNNPMYLIQLLMSQSLQLFMRVYGGTSWTEWKQF